MKGRERMITIFDKGEIIKLKQRDISNREVSRRTGINRKTIAKVWNAYCEDMKELENCNSQEERRSIQEKIISTPIYDASNRKRKKYTEEMDAFIDELLKQEEEKAVRLGKHHKQKITNVMIHQELRKQGFDIGITTVSMVVKGKRDKLKETFIRQSYELGQRLEFDFGEVTLIINHMARKYHLAVLSSPAANYRMAYLYDNQGKQVFQDAHVQFFEEVQGVYKEIVYDNMRNVVSKFIGRNEKVLNEDLVKMSIYYGFEINTTNCFKGNEKGHVEGSVKHIRRQAFTIHYEFESIEEARVHLRLCLDQMNQDSRIEEEKEHLLAKKAKLEIGEFMRLKVNKYAVIRIENNFYSVPEELNGKEVSVKNYIADIEVYYQHKLVCKHKKLNGFLEYKIDIFHYLKTFKTKPNALRNSQALVNNEELKELYEKHYKKKEKLFIELIEEHKHLAKEELNQILKTNYNAVVKVEQLEERIIEKSKNQIHVYTNILKGAHHERN